MKWSDKSNSFRGMEQRETVFITVVYIITMFFLMSHKWQKKKKERNTSQFFTNNAMLHRYTARSIHVYSFKKISRDTSQRSSKNRLVRAKFFLQKAPDLIVRRSLQYTRTFATYVTIIGTQYTGRYIFFPLSIGERSYFNDIIPARWFKTVLLR